MSDQSEITPSHSGDDAESPASGGGAIEVAAATREVTPFRPDGPIATRFNHPLVNVASTSISNDGMTPTGMAMAGVSVVALVMAALSAQPAVAVFAIPYLVSLMLGALSHVPDTFMVKLDSEHPRVLEGDEITMVASITSEVGIERCTVELEPGPKLEIVSAPRVTVAVAPGVAVQVPFVVRVVRWGLIQPERLLIRAEDRFSVFARSYQFSVRGDIRAALPVEPLRDTIEPGRYRSNVGSHRSEQRGQGMELADVREYRAGDPLKSINWRITNRRGEPWVTVRHPDRAATVVIVADMYSAFGTNLHPGVVRAVESLVNAHLALHDRVGALLLGADTAWIPPQLGERQRYRISDALIDATRWQKTWGKPDLNKLVDSDAVILVVSTLRDRRVMHDLAQLRAGGHQLSILEPLSSGDDVPDAEPGTVVDQAIRLDRLSRDVTRRAFREDGFIVVPWDTNTPIEPAIRNLRIVYGAQRVGQR